MSIRFVSRFGLVVAVGLGLFGTVTASGAAFTQVPVIQNPPMCPQDIFGHTLVTPATGPLSFSVTGVLSIHTTGAGFCIIAWTVEQALVGPAGMWQNSTVLAGFVDVPAGGMVNLIRAATDHSNEAGMGIATAQAAGPLGPGLGIPFGAAQLGAPFAHAGVPETLRQEMRIELTPGPAGGFFTFRFPVDSATAPVPEPSTGTTLLLASIVIGY